MIEALLYEKISGARVRCRVCQWRCVIMPGKSGVCRARRNDNGVLRVLNYAEVTSMASDPVEKKPLNHFYPGSTVFSMGTWGCNFRCDHCQNWQISCVKEPGEMDRQVRMVTPQEAIAMAIQHGCQGIAWTYNEPTIWFEYTLDCAKLARQKKLYTVYVTNGFIAPEALDTIGPYLDAWRVDLKGFSDILYRDLSGITMWRGILDAARNAKDKWGMHVEVITNVIPSMNDDEEQLAGIANWICRELGELTPWHITRFYPHYHLSHLPPTPLATMETAYRIGKKAGLRFVYLGNVPGNDKENTFCYSCGKVVISRIGYNTRVTGIDGSNCVFCGAELNIRTTLK
jgi:pyruvate formate lyase activating enzyme